MALSKPTLLPTPLSYSSIEILHFVGPQNLGLLVLIFEIYLVWRMDYS